jgi:mannose-6-phosphate isomerase-like protein (cupin superfamily)
MSRRAASALSLAALLLLAGTSFAQTPRNDKPHAKVVVLDNQGEDYLPILAGPPESVTMKSGLVVLAPGKSVGKHTTGHYEELLIVLSGTGEMTFENSSKLPVDPKLALYCPPHTEHNVTNTGTVELRYIYVVAAAR